MKKCRLVAVVVLVVCVPGMSFDQDMIEKGVIGGINYASFGGADAGGGDRYPKRLLRYTAGGFAAFKLNQNILIRPEVHYSMKGAKYEESEDPKGLDAEIRINYLDIPVLFVFAPQPQLQVYTGPMLGVYLSGEYYFKYARYGNEWEDIEKKGHITNPDFKFEPNGPSTISCLGSKTKSLIFASSQPSGSSFFFSKILNQLINRT